MPTADRADHPTESDDPTPPIGVLVADSHPLVRTGLRALLEHADVCRVLGEAVSLTALVWEVRRTKPDVVVVDIDLPGAEQGLREVSVPTLLLGEDGPADRIVSMLAGSVRGFVRKCQPSCELVRAVRAVADGHACLPPEVIARLLDAYVAHDDQAIALPGPIALTRREHDVLRLMAEGRSTTEIAASLVVQVSTVKTHVCHVLHKLGVSDRAQAVAAAYRWRLVSAGGRPVLHRPTEVR